MRMRTNKMGEILWNGKVEVIYNGSCTATLDAQAVVCSEHNDIRLVVWHSEGLMGQFKTMQKRWNEVLYRELCKYVSLAYAIDEGSCEADTHNICLLSHRECTGLCTTCEELSA